jgi:hypothetical protein
MATKKEINKAYQEGQITLNERNLLRDSVDRAAKTGKGISASETARLNQALQQAKTSAIAKGGVTAEQLLGTAAQRREAFGIGTTPTGEGDQTGGGGEDPGIAYQKALQEAERKSAFRILQDTFKQYGLDSLVSDIQGFMQEGISPEEATLRLRETESYKTRFKGNEGRIAKGLAAYSPGEYLQAEEQYRNILASSGLQDLATQENFNSLIGGAVSAVEVQDRVLNVFNRIDNADSALKQQLGQYFGQYGVNDPSIQRSQIAKALLTGETTAQNLQRSLQKAQLRTGAAQYNVVIAEANIEQLQQQLEAQGVSDVYGTAQTGFRTLAETAPTTTKLAEIYKTDTAGLEQELQQEAFFGLASQRRKKLQEKEQAAFAGEAGTSQVSLTQRPVAGQI